MTTRKSIADRFWSKVHKTDTCWLWTAAIDKRGYGRFRADEKVEFAHRVSFLLAHGHYPEHQALHACDVPLCVNPAHIYDGTQKENIQDSIRRNRNPQLIPRTHCPAGHELTPENVYNYRGRNGWSMRSCRKCIAAHQRRAYQKRKVTQ